MNYKRNNINMKNIDKIIKEEIKRERKNHLVKSINQLNDIKDNDFFFEQYFETSLNLLDEGYTIEEIDLISEQSIGERLGGSVWGALKDLTGQTNIKQALGGGGLSALSEYAINFLLTQILGFHKNTANFLSSFFADTDPRILLRPFKSPELCAENLPKISDSLMEGMAAYLQGKNPPDKQWKETSQLAIRNIFADAVRQSSLGETIAGKVCNMIWKTKEDSVSVTPTTRDTTPMTKLPSRELNTIPTSMTKKLIPPKQ